MIFHSDGNFEERESYKERNLYYKIFAGYLFNELLPDADSRKDDFFNLLISVLDYEERFRGDKSHIGKILSEARQQKVHVTFDYHSCQIIKEHKQNNRGEMSDVLLLTGPYFISIECKFLTDIHFNKDVNEVQERIKAVSNKLSMTPLQVLLMKKSKWDFAKKINKNNGSFYTAFQNATVYTPVIVLFWDELFSLITNTNVENYLRKQIARKNIKFI